MKCAKRDVTKRLRKFAKLDRASPVLNIFRGLLRLDLLVARFVGMKLHRSWPTAKLYLNNYKGSSHKNLYKLRYM